MFGSIYPKKKKKLLKNLVDKTQQPFFPPFNFFFVCLGDRKQITPIKTK